MVFKEIHMEEVQELMVQILAINKLYCKCNLYRLKLRN